MLQNEDSPRYRAAAFGFSSKAFLSLSLFLYLFISYFGFYGTNSIGSKKTPGLIYYPFSLMVKLKLKSGTMTLNNLIWKANKIFNDIELQAQSHLR